MSEYVNSVFVERNNFTNIYIYERSTYVQIYYLDPACYDFIQALDKCHQKAYYKRILGICNNEKEALSQCLKQASLENKKKAIIESKSKRTVIEDKWKKIDEEEYGEDKVLEILMQRMREKKINPNNNDDTSQN